MTTGGRARKGRIWLLAGLMLLVASACGTRLPDSAFVNAEGGATGGPAARRATTGSGAGTAAGSTASTGAGAALGGGATGDAGAAGGGGGDTGGGGGGADGPNQASDVGVTENEIVIGNITAQDGILGAAFKPPLFGLTAWVQWINDQGGIHGRKVRLESCNDKEDRTRTLQCAQDLVENKKVFAFVANNTRSEGGAAPYINGQGVPVFSDIPITNAPYRFPHYWTVYGTACPRDGNTVCGSDHTNNTTGIYRWFKQNTGASKAAVFYYGLIGESKQAGDFVKKGLQLEGYQVVDEDVNFANPNFDQSVQDMKKQGVDIMFDVIDDGANRKLCDTMQRYGFSVKAKVSTVVSYGDEVGDNFADVCRNSVYISGSTVSYDDVSNPAVKEFRDAYSTYEPDAPLHQWALEGWMAGKAFADAVGSMGAAPTRSGLEAWLSGLHGYTNGGLSVPIDYQSRPLPPDENTAIPFDNDCFTIAHWQDDAKGWIQAANTCMASQDFITPVTERGD